MLVRLWIIASCLIGIYPYATQGQTINAQTKINNLLRSIVPIETKAEDVKKLLGEPRDRSPDFYQFDGFNVMVSYTSGLPCEKEPDYGWNVPGGRVNTFAMIVTSAFHQKDLKNFGIDLSIYEKSEGGDFPGEFPETAYTNRKEGITIMINGDQVTSIDLFPAKKYLHLMCPNTNAKPVFAEREVAVSLP
jgi:hypothetical protein